MTIMKTKLQNIINTNETNKKKGLILIDFDVNKENVEIDKFVTFDGKKRCNVSFIGVKVNLIGETVSSHSISKSSICFLMDLTDGTCTIEFCVLKTDLGFMKYIPAEVKVDDVKEYFKEIGLDVNLD